MSQASLKLSSTAPAPRVRLLHGSADDLLEDVEGTSQRFDLVHADPPWAYRQHGARGAIGLDYEQLDTAAIVRTLGAARRVANREAYLAVWTTSPTMGELWTAIHAEPLWAWEYIGFAAWDKELMGTGWHLRGQVELVLYWRRGDLTSHSNSIRNHWTVKRGDHSAKPVEICRDLLEAFTPSGGRVLDLYAGRGVPVGIAAGRSGRTYLGAELDEDRHREACARLELAGIYP